MEGFRLSGCQITTKLFHNVVEQAEWVYHGAIFEAKKGNS